MGFVLFRLLFALAGDEDFLDVCFAADFAEDFAEDAFALRFDLGLLCAFSDFGGSFFDAPGSALVSAEAFSGALFDESAFTESFADLSG